MLTSFAPFQPLLSVLTFFGLWSKLGRLTHYAFDAVLCKYLQISLLAACHLANILDSLRVSSRDEAFNRPHVSLSPR